MHVSLGLKQSIFVKAVTIYVAVGYYVMIFLYFVIWCRPFSDYWSVPAVNRKLPNSTRNSDTERSINDLNSLLCSADDDG